jgi:hypothetical protein
MTSYKKLFTTYGKNKITSVLADETTLKISKMVIGDANGSIYSPTVSQTKLINQRDILDITEFEKKGNKYRIFAQIPANIDNYIIREVGLIDDKNKLLWVSQFDMETISSIDNLVVQNIIGVQLEFEQGVNVSLVDNNILTATKTYVDTTFQKKSEKGYNYCPLNEKKLVPTEYLPVNRIQNMYKTGDLEIDYSGLKEVRQYASSLFKKNVFNITGGLPVTNDGIVSDFASSKTADVSIPQSVLDNPFIIVWKGTNSSDYSTKFFDFGGIIQLGRIYSNGFYVLKLNNSDDLQIFKGLTSHYNQSYFGKLEFTGTSYQVTLTFDDGYVFFMELQSSEKVNAGVLQVGGSLNSNSIDLKYFKIFSNGKLYIAGNETRTDNHKFYQTVGDVSVSNNVASNFGVSDYIKTDKQIRSLNSWELQLKITTGETVSTTYAQTIYTGGYNASSRTILIQISTTGKFSMFLGTGSSSWNITENFLGNYNVLANTSYYLKIGFTGAKYYLKYSLNGSTYTEDISVTSSSKIGTYKQYLGMYVGSNNNYSFKGTIDLSEFKYFEDDILKYQACLGIPYVLSSTGAKISYDRDAVNKYYLINGYTPYYTLDENSTNNYTIVGNPNINMIGIEEIPSQKNAYNNYVKSPQIIFGQTFSISLKFHITTLNEAFRVIGEENSILRVYARATRIDVRFKASDNSTVVLSQDVSMFDDIENHDYTINVEFDGSKYLLNIYQDNLLIYTNVTKTSLFPLYDRLNTQGSSGNFDNVYSINLNKMTVTVDGETKYRMITPPNFTLPKGDIYGMINNLNNNLNSFGLKDGTNLEYPYVKKTYISGNSWYRIYSDGWCEQGGYKADDSTTDTYTLTFLKPYKDNTYMFSLIQQYTDNPVNNPIIRSKPLTGVKVYAERAFWWKAEGYIA